jgi:tight adherence protein B
MLIVGLTFVLCATIILGFYWAFIVRPEESAARKLRKRLTPAPAEDRPVHTDLTREEAPFSALKVLDAALVRSGHVLDPVRHVVANSGLRVTVGALLLACGFAAIVMFIALDVVTGSPAFGAVVAILVGALPHLWVRRAATKRLNLMEEQLPQAVEMIAVSLRAGHAFTTGLLMVAEEIPNPLGAEFRLLYDQQTYGKPVPDVLREFAKRVPLLDARIFVTAVLTQRETGGNLAELLDKLAALVRERFRVRRQVRVLSAHGRISGWTLACLPPVLAVVLFLIAPSQIRVLVEDPLGRMLTAVAAGLQLIGVVAIRRIVNVEF